MNASQDDWRPLEELLGVRGASEWMFMGRPSPGVCSYKHIDSRRYLHLDLCGGAWFYDAADDLMRPVVRAAAVRYALCEVDERPEFTDR